MARQAAGFIPLHGFLKTSARADIHLSAMHIEPEHVHGLLSLRLEMAVATTVQRLKGANSRQMRRLFVHLHALHQQRETG